MVELFGYSERGMVNAVCDDIVHSEDSLSALREFLSLLHFPPTYGEQIPRFKEISKARILVEQGFSDFGDLDLLILIDYLDERKQAILVEAKVHTATSSKSIHHRWRDFQRFLQGDEDKRSNLFVQLYRKNRLVQKVADFDHKLTSDAVARRWSLGKNKVVRKAARQLSEYCAGQYCEEPLFVALVPDSYEATSEFFANSLTKYSQGLIGLPDWDTSRWGFLTWPELKAHCDNAPQCWQSTIRNFDWNEGEIYKQPNLVVGGNEIVRNNVYLLTDVRVLVVRVGSLTCRCVPLENESLYFPVSQPVNSGELHAIETQPDTEIHGVLKAVNRNRYRWHPPDGDNPQPNGKAAVPNYPTMVIMLQASWVLSRVREVDDGDNEIGDPFHVYSHHILR